MNTKVFKNPWKRTMSAREVALLDPFHKREIKIPPHPFENEINEFTAWYWEFCEKNNLKPIVITPHTFEAQRKNIVEAIKAKLEESDIDKKDVTKAMIDSFSQEKTVEFIKKFKWLVNLIDFTNWTTQKKSKKKAWNSEWIIWQSPIENNESKEMNPEREKIEKIANFASEVVTIKNDILKKWFDWVSMHVNSLIKRAIKTNNEQMVSLLLEFWANPFYRNASNNISNIEIAKFHKYDYIIKLLEERITELRNLFWQQNTNFNLNDKIYELEINSIMTKWCTLLMSLIIEWNKTKNWKPIQRVLQMWASLQITNEYWMTALEIAKSIQFHEAVKILEKEEERRTLMLPQKINTTWQSPNIDPSIEKLWDDSSSKLDIFSRTANSLIIRTKKDSETVLWT